MPLECSTMSSCPTCCLIATIDVCTVKINVQYNGTIGKAREPTEIFSALEMNAFIRLVTDKSKKWAWLTAENLTNNYTSKELSPRKRNM